VTVRCEFIHSCGVSSFADSEPGNVSCHSILCRYFDDATPELLTPTSVSTSHFVIVAEFSKYKALLQRMVYHSLIDDRNYWTL
jgi:hypothetical protein